MNKLIENKKSLHNKNLELVKDIIKINKITNPSTIQAILLNEHQVSLSTRSIKKYKVEINKKKIIAGQFIETPIVVIDNTPKKKETQKPKYPCTISCPNCHRKFEMTTNPIQSVGCGNCCLAYDRNHERWFKPHDCSTNENINLD